LVYRRHPTCSSRKTLACLNVRKVYVFTKWSLDISVLTFFLIKSDSLLSSFLSSSSLLLSPPPSSPLCFTLPSFSPPPHLSPPAYPRLAPPPPRPAPERRRVQCFRCGEACKGEVLKVQSRHFHFNCFTCKGEYRSPPGSLALPAMVPVPTARGAPPGVT